MGSEDSSVTNIGLLFFLLLFPVFSHCSTTQYLPLRDWSLPVPACGPKSSFCHNCHKSASLFKHGRTSVSLQFVAGLHYIWEYMFPRVLSPTGLVWAGARALRACVWSKWALRTYCLVSAEESWAAHTVCSVIRSLVPPPSSPNSANLMIVNLLCIEL